MLKKVPRRSTYLQFYVGAVCRTGMRQGPRETPRWRYEGKQPLQISSTDEAEEEAK